MLEKLPNKSRLLATTCIAALVGCQLAITRAPGEAQPAQAPIDFNFQVRPILADRCFACHGPDEKKRKADLRLDSRESALAAGVIVPGKINESKLIERITATDKTRMPPPKSNLHLSPGEIDTLRRWIAQGADYKAHWAFLPLPDKVTVPPVSDPHWPEGPLDRFILARLDRDGIKPSPPAAREDWIRRVTFDLTGLPPRPTEVDAFLADRSPQAFERVADRLLSSPHFGERLAVEWLDAARYADSYGYQSDSDNLVWPWRDWVIQAFNENLPFDQFLTWQVAGDLLENPTRQQQMATAFCRLHRMTGEGGSIAEEFRNEYVSDRVHTMGTVFLGLTLECTRCHDHKYDPLTMRDYYALGAFFNSIDEWGTYDSTTFRATPTLLLPTPAQESGLATARKQVRELEARLAEAGNSRESAFRHWLGNHETALEIPGLVGHYALDRIGDKNALDNLVDPKNPGTTAPANSLAPGRTGHAIRFTGDDPVNFPKVLGSIDRAQPFTVSFWLRTPQVMQQGIVFHRQSGTDTGFHGIELSFDEGKLFLALIRFWPGNACAIRTLAKVPAEHWTNIAVRYDGSGKAAGMGIYVDGARVPCDVVRDNLNKNLQASGSGLTFGERFRSTGLKGCLLDDVMVFDRALDDVEIVQLHNGGGTSGSRPDARQNLTDARRYYLDVVDPEMKRVRAELQQARQRLFNLETGVAEIMAMRDMPEPRRAYVLARGAYDAPRDKPVDRDVPASFPPFPKDAPRNRLGLARWLTDPRHPLTARVAVNRFWQMFLGRGLVTTTENFGTQGALPSHPELLDWLARDFVGSGWDMKRLCRQIVLSSTYRQRSAATPELRSRDPDNILLARGPARRLSAEMVRDLALAAGGILVEKIGGPPVKPYQPPKLWKGQNAFLPEYVPDKGEGLHRRSLYTFWRRTSPPPNMLAFDVPTRETCIVRRQSTSTPLQALVLLNDPQFTEAARGLGERMLRESGTSPEERLRFAFRTTATRKPTERELAVLVDLYAAQRQRFRDATEAAKKYLQIGDRPPPADLDATELAAAAVVANALLNLDAAVMIR